MAYGTTNSGFTIDLGLLSPFYFILDKNLIIQEIGPAIKKYTGSTIGTHFAQTFQIRDIVSPLSGLDTLFQEEGKKLFILDAKDANLSFKGYFVASNDRNDAVFIGNPILDSKHLTKDPNLEIEDFAPHDTIKETFEIIRLQEKSAAKLKLEAGNYLLESDLLNKIINLVPQQIFLKDSESRFLVVNQKMAELFGVEIKDIIGKTDYDFWPDKEEVDFYRNIDRKVIESNQKFEVAEEPQTNKEGKKGFNHVVKMPFTMANGERCVLGIAIDITDIKETQQAKFEIASGILHDIGNGVVGFGSYLNRIKKQIEQNNTKNLENLATFFATNKPKMVEAIGEPKANALIEMLVGITNSQKNCNEEIQKSVTELYNIVSHIQDILDIQRQYVTGQETSKRKRIDLSGIINDCVSMAFAAVDKRQISLSVDLQPKIPLIKGDRTKLMQVILNLFKNSAESIDNLAENKNISVRLYTSSDNIVLEIQDSGSGFDPEISSKLFERGYTTKSTGTGFGLYNCRQIIESHSGTVTIESEGVGKGAKVEVKLKIT